MSRPAIAACRLAFHICALLALVCAVSCQRRKEELVPLGHVSASFALPDGTVVNALDYKITGGTITPLSGHLDVTKSSQTVSTIADLPAARGYLISADASSADGATTCHGQTSFDVSANLATQVALVVLCRRSLDAGEGSVSVMGAFDDCPVVNAHWITGTSGALGKLVRVGVDVTDPDPADSMRPMPITYTWTVAPAGAVAFLITSKNDPNTAASVNTQEFSCGLVGDVTIKVEASDGVCTKTVTIPFRCLAYAPAQASGACVHVTSYAVGSRYVGLPAGEALPVMVAAASAASSTVTYQWTASPPTGGTFAQPGGASTTFTCADGSGDVMLSVSAADGVCAADVRSPVVTVKCLPGLARPDGGRPEAGRPDAGHADANAQDAASGEGGRGGGGAGGTSAGGTAGTMATGGSAGGGSAGGGGSGGGNDSGGSLSCPIREAPSTSAACDTCTTSQCSLGASGTDGCCGLPGGDVVLCETLARCFGRGRCTSMGDATSCFCGTAGGACFMTEGAANGPCATEVIAAAKTSAPAAIYAQFVAPTSPVGRAVNVTACRGSFCSQECDVP